jgi:hypothetical protein
MDDQADGGLAGTLTGAPPNAPRRDPGGDWPLPPDGCPEG